MFNTYFAKTEGGGYTLIHNGSPVCTSNRTLQDCIAVAKLYNLEVPDRIWDGVEGRFLPVEKNI